MADSQTAKRTPLANDPVGAIVGEFIEEKRREIDEEKARRAPRKPNPFVAPFLIVLALAAWVAPSFLPTGTQVVSEETFEQGARLNLYLASLRVREYQANNKVLPADLLQAGVDSAGVKYTRLANNAEFQLSTQAPSGEIVYRSTQPDSALLRGMQLRGIR